MLGYRTPHFSEAEISCRCGCGEVSRLRLLKALEQVRVAIDRPMRVNSAVRCDDHNEEVGGVPDSYHLKGVAVDIDTFGWTDEEYMSLRELAYAAGFRGFGLYNNFIHLDLRDEFTLWDNRGE
jgi:uncharacterized protein YcbK (DUF882 family)